ncbi:hypothetical protein LCGC14_1333220 [marine sediment metagenome]|uniref:Uncharacterized protein n=1 Tax=marine sediment metagenome TaxID=412755 RepID=A0A0F9KGL9_9ZZZZ
MTTAPKWYVVVDAHVPDEQNPNKSCTYVMRVLDRGVLVRVVDWSLGSLSVALEFLPGACLVDFGIEEAA